MLWVSGFDSGNTPGEMGLGLTITSFKGGYFVFCGKCMVSD
jgi:hypothetical protein